MPVSQSISLYGTHISRRPRVSRRHVCKLGEAIVPVGQGGKWTLFCRKSARIKDEDEGTASKKNVRFLSVPGDWRRTPRSSRLLLFLS